LLGFFDPSGDQALANCLQELSDPVDPFGQGQPKTAEAALVRATYLRRTNQCIAQGTFLATLYSSQRSYESGRHYLWLLASWTRLHTFIAREATELAALDKVLLSSREAASGMIFPNLSSSKPQFEAMLDLMEDGWGLVLAQEHAGPSGGKLATMDNSAAFAPDYREEVALGAGPVPISDDHNQPSGLAPALLEGLAVYFGLVENYLGHVDRETASRSNTGTLAAKKARAIARGGDAVRIAAVLERMANRIHEKASSHCAVTPYCTTVPWETRWTQGLEALGAARASLLSQVHNMVTNKNPLGVPEEDLPLFFGDVVGDNSRFFASSDYLLNVWAVPAVATAEADLAQAQEAWISQRNSVLQDQLLAVDRQRRLEAIAQQFAEPIIEGCGLAESGNSTPGGVADPLTVLQTFGSGQNAPSPQTCFVSKSADCMGAATPNGVRQTLLSALELPAVKYQLCLWRKLSGYLRLPSDVAFCAEAYFTAEMSGDNIVCGGVAIDKQVLWNDYGIIHVDPVVVHGAEASCQQSTQYQRLPVPVLPASCYRGRAGEAMAQLNAATAETETALAQFDVAQVAFDGQTKLCDLEALTSGNQQAMRAGLQELRDATWEAHDFYWQEMDDFRIQQGLASSGGFPPNFYAGVLGWPSADLERDLDEADLRLQLSEAYYQDIVQHNNEQKDLMRCLNQAEVYRAEVTAALGTLRTQTLKGRSAALALSNEVATIAQAIVAGRAAYAREENRKFAGYSHHYWLDDKMHRYRRDFFWAQRLTYLAMRAIEYEFQQSSALRPAILTAQHPDQLEDVLLVLKQDQASRSINRRRPEELSVVLSVRDDILRIQDHSAAPPGERNYTPARRFQGRLSEPQYAQYDTNGDWMGQGIRFAVDPTAGSGQAGVALASRCAERLWRVTATIQGDAVSPLQPGASVYLLKNNSFASQWCNGLSDGSSLQQASISPSHNLFKPADANASVGDAKAYTTAAIYPWFNIRRTEFYSPAFQNGASEELAGRGLYGDYILLFPRELLAAGFNLDRVEDILLRFDYLSVDNLAPIAPN
jgi:hypothetical protein